MRGEEWSETMRRMRLRVDRALQRFPIEPWSIQLLRRQFRLAVRIGNSSDSWAHRAVAWLLPETVQAQRGRGRPRTRWDDRLGAFSLMRGGQSWFEDARQAHFKDLEDEFVQNCVKP